MWCAGCWSLVSRIGVCNVVCKLLTCRIQIAHAGKRTRVTSMGGLYDTATLRALPSAVLLSRFVSVVMVVVTVLVCCVVLVRCSSCCGGCGLCRLRCNSQIVGFVVSSYCSVGRAQRAHIAPIVGLKPTTARLMALRSADWARLAFCAIVFPVVHFAIYARSGYCRRRCGWLIMLSRVWFEAPPAGLEPAIFGLEVRRLVH